MRKLLSLIILIFCSIKLWANVAAPSQGGQTLTEPKGINTIAIEKEDLNIDFIQLNDENLPWNERFINVEAIYKIDNPADIEKLQLVFVIVSEAKNFQFFLDDKEVAYELIDNKEFSDRNSWKKPDRTPFESREILYNPYNGKLKSAKFTLNLPKGKHQLKAKYKAEPTVYKDLGVMKGWQFAYSLAPARDWKSFGGLNLNIKIPQHWKFYSNLKLEQNGEMMTGNFQEIPADFLAVTTQAPIPSRYYLWADTTFYLFMASLFLIPVLIIGLAIWKGFNWKNAWVYGFLVGLVWALLVGITGYLSDSLPKSFIPEGQYATYGYGDLFGIFFLAILVPITFFGGIILWAVPVLVKSKKRA